MLRLTLARIAVAPAILALPLLAAAPAAAQPDYPWTPIGADDAHVLSFNALRRAIGTDVGFRFLNGNEWILSEEPGAEHREVTALIPLWGSHDFLTGRVDADGHGYLERDLWQQPPQVAHAPACGPFVDFAGYDGIVDSKLWACSRADDEPGQLVVSTDRAQTWTVLTGHGQQDLYDLYWDETALETLIVVGDAGIAATPDGGLTWHDISAGLPRGAHVRRLHEDTLWIDIPDKLAGEIWACTDAGIFAGYYDSATGTCTWQPTPLTAEPVLSVGFFYLGHGLGGALAVTDDQRVLLDFFNWDWADVTGELAGSTFLPLGPSTLVATADDGLWYLSNLTTAVDDVPAAGLSLGAAPNPFNPTTVLRYDVPAAGRATLRVYDLGGRLVETLLDAEVAAGPGEVIWRPEDAGSGTYVARLEAGGRVARQKLMLVR